MKKTGNESNQGHRAKMNSSDRFGLDQSVESDDWTKVISKSAKRLARKKEQQVSSSTNKNLLKKKKNSKIAPTNLEKIFCSSIHGWELFEKFQIQKEEKLGKSK